MCVKWPTPSRYMPEGNHGSGYFNKATTMIPCRQARHVEEMATLTMSEISARRNYNESFCFFEKKTRKIC